LIAERAVAANTVSATAAALRVEFPEAVGLVLPGGSTTSLKLVNGVNVTTNNVVESGLL
jgi:phospholipid N-methyltransferase